MTSLDLFYRAFKTYKEITVTDVSLSRSKKVIQNKNSNETQNLTVYVSTCTIEEDWVNEVERGIEFIVKAIKEERQFIRNDGEVLPIEKVRRTSKASIEDLAKHSNYITHEAMEGATTDVVPDKLLVVQKEHDFAVYENRVVYTLLMYLRDFISSRLTVIKDITNTYKADAFIKQNIELGNTKLDIDFSLHDVRKNDPILMEKNSCKDIIARLDEVLSKVLILLKTPLMIEVSKSDMVSLPIVKTNVLKMNRNFRECVALFEYLLSYNKPGYLITTEEKDFAPFALDMVGDYAENVMLFSFINYMYGNSLEEQLKEEFYKEEERRKKQEEEELLERANRIRLKAKMDDKTINEYLIILEEAYRILEKNNEALKEEMKQMEIKHQKEVADLHKMYQDRIDTLKEEHQKEIEELTAKHQAEITRMNEEFEREKQDIKDKAEEEKNRIIEEARTEKENLVNSYEEELSTVRSNAREERESLISKYEEEIETIKTNAKEEKDAAIVDMRTRMEEAVDNEKTMKEERKVAVKENSELRARIIALENSNGRQDVSKYTGKAAFDQLEKDKKAFNEFYERAWKAAKESIRKNTLKIDKTKRKDRKKNEEKVEEGNNND